MNESKPVAEVKSQLAANVSHYSRIYAECRIAARETLGPEATEDSILYATDTLFNRFCEDQTELAKEHKKQKDLKAMLQPIFSMLERRGLFV